MLLNILIISYFYFLRARICEYAFIFTKNVITCILYIVCNQTDKSVEPYDSLIINNLDYINTYKWKSLEMAEN